MKKLLPFLLLFLVGTLRLTAATEALLVPPTDEAQAGRLLKLKLYLNNPSAEAYDFIVPDDMRADIASASEQRRLAAVVPDLLPGTKIRVAPMSFATLTVAVVLPDTLDGTVSLRLVDLPTNAVMFAVTPAPVVRATPRAVRAAEIAAENKGEDVDLATDRENVRRHISSYEPIYFAVGFNDGANAKFQFSFKYRLITPNNNDPEWWRSLYFGYTQTSLWDLSAPSAPFYDTSYKPSLFYYRESLPLKPGWLSRLGLQAGLQHESNGKDSTASRSLNTAYVTPIALWSMAGNWRLQVSPRFIVYLEKTDNEDIAHYRGNVELQLRFGQDKGLQLNAILRKGNDSGYGSGQLDVTWPLRRVPGVSPNAGGYLQLQYFNGWGESLLDYNKRDPAQLRFGYTIVR
jgi:outer membrane phospholipase A